MKLQKKVWKKVWKRKKQKADCKKSALSKIENPSEIKKTLIFTKRHQ